MGHDSTNFRVVGGKFQRCIRQEATATTTWLRGLRNEGEKQLANGLSWGIAGLEVGHQFAPHAVIVSSQRRNEECALVAIGRVQAPTVETRAVHEVCEVAS